MIKDPCMVDTKRCIVYSVEYMVYSTWYMVHTLGGPGYLYPGHNRSHKPFVRPICRASQVVIGGTVLVRSGYNSSGLQVGALDMHSRKCKYMAVPGF